MAASPARDTLVETHIADSNRNANKSNPSSQCLLVCTNYKVTQLELLHFQKSKKELA